MGVSVGTGIAENWRLHLGGGYSRKGFVLDAFGVDVTTEIAYLEFTALAGRSASLAESALLHLLAGPALAFRVACRSSGSNTFTFMGEDFGEDIDEDCDDTSKSMDLGLAAGARVEIGLSEKAGLSVGALYNPWAVEHGRQR